MFGRRKTEMIRRKNVVEIRKPEATYTVLYGIHVRTQNQDELPHDLDALVLETGIHEWEEDPVRCVETMREHVQYRDLFKKAEKERIPIVFTDLKYKYSDSILLMVDNMTSAIQWMGGARLLKQVFLPDKKEGTKRKKSFGKTAISVGVAAWMILPFFSTVMRLVSSLTGKGEHQTAELKKFSHRVHPETELLYLQIRNAVIAEKEVYLAKMLGRKPHIATVLGAGHVGIEDMLAATPEERGKYFQNIQPLLKLLARPEYLYKMAVVEFDGKTWRRKEMYDVPELNRLTL